MRWRGGRGRYHRAMSPLGRALITTFGLGHLRPASGTWGSLPPALAAAGLVLAGQSHTWLWWAVFTVVAGLFGAACVRWGHVAEHVYLKKDPGQVVADETCGMALALLPLPLLAPRAAAAQLVLVGAAFVLFRLLDIVKPPPARGVQAVPGGWGILLDDVAAGLYAGGLVLVLAPWLVPAG